MNCTLTFTINGVAFQVDNVPLESIQDRKITGATFLDTLYEVLPSKDLALFTKALETNLTQIPVQSYDLPKEISVYDLMGSTRVPNRTNQEIHNLINTFASSKKEDLNLIQLIKSLLPIDGAKISFLSKSILIPGDKGTLGTAHGYFDASTGHAYVTVPDEKAMKRVHLERIAHELVHSELNQLVSTEGSKVRKMLQVVIEDLKKFKFVINSTTPTHIKKSQELVKLILSKDGNLQLEELLAYYLTDVHLQTFLTDLEVLSVSFLMNEINSKNKDQLESIVIRHAEEAPIIKVENDKSITEGITSNKPVTESFIQEVIENSAINTFMPADDRSIGDFAVIHGNKLFTGTFLKKIGNTFEISDPSTGLSVAFPTTTPFYAQHNLPFAEESYETLDMAETLPDSWDKGKQAEIAKKVRDRFKANKVTSEYNTFDINYGDRVDLYEIEDEVYYDISTKNLQIANLKQNDLVMLPQDLGYDKNAKRWEVNSKVDAKYKDKSSYRPIIGIYIRESDGAVMVRVPSADGTKIFSIPAEFVSSYRKYRGDLKIEELYTPEINEMIAKRKEELLAIFEFSNPTLEKEKETTKEKENRINREDLVKDYGLTEENAPLKMITWNDRDWTIPSNIQSIGYSFKDPEYAQTIYAGIKAGDIVKASWKKDGKVAGHYRAIVTRVFGNCIEIVTANPDKGPVIVRLDSLSEIIYRNENHPEIAALLEENPVEDLYYEEYDKNNKLRTSISDEFNVHDFTSIHSENGKIVESTPDYYKLNSFEGFKNLTKEEKQSFLDSHESQLNKKRYYTSKLKPGDLIKVSWNIKNQRSSGWYPVIGTTKNTIFFYSFNKQTGNRSIQSVNLNASYETDEKSISRIAYNNSKEADLFDWFEQLRSKYSSIFEDDNSKWAGNMGEALRSGQALGLEEDFYMSSFDLTGIEDPEIIRQIETEKFKQVTQLSRGDIIAKDLGNGKYKWVVVTDIAPNGLPIVVTYSKEFEKTFRSGKKFTTKAGYKVYELDLDQILYIGRNTKVNLEVGVAGNTTLMNELTDIKEALLHFNDPIIYDTLDTAKKAGYIKWGNVGKNDIKGKLAEVESADKETPNIKKAVYGKNKAGESVWAATEGFLTTVLEPPKGEQKYFIVSDYGLYFSKHLSKFETLYNTKKIEDPKGLHQELEPGDVLVETWDYNGKPVYMNSVIVKKNKHTLIVNRVKFDQTTGKVSYSKHTILRKTKEDVEYPGILRVYFAKKGRGKLEDFKNGATDAVYRLLGLVSNKRTIGSAPNVNKRSTSTREFAKKATRRPFSNKGFTSSKEDMAFKKSQDSMETVAQVVTNLNDTYDLGITMLRSEEIASRYGSEAASYRAFIDNEGKVCINLDRASAADPLHESGHLILAGLSKIDPELYDEILQQVSLHPDFGKIALAYQEKTEEEVKGEVFATLFGEHYRKQLLRSQPAKEWHSENEGLFKRILNFVRNMFSRSFKAPEIEDYTDNQMYETSLEKLMTAFGDNLMEGNFKHALSQGEMIYGRKIDQLKNFLLGQGEDSLVGLTKICRT